MDLSRFIAMAAKLDRLDYYQILGVPRTASTLEVQQAFHKRARSAHPDRFYGHDNEEFRRAIDKIYKRIAESYIILRDQEKRRKYDAGLQGPQRKLRYTDEDEIEQRTEQREETGKTPQGRKLYEEAKRLHQAGFLQKAIQALRMAVSFEKENKHFQELLHAWSEELRLSDEN